MTCGRGVVFIGLALIAACAERDGDAKGEAQSESSVAADEPGTSEPSPGARGEGNDALPPIDLEPPDDTRLAEARTLNQQGLDAQQAERYDEAIEHYQAAVAADPGHLLARYNLATAYSLAGEPERALAILEALGNVDNCPVCVGRLVRAREDDDFASLHGDPEFVELTGAAEVPELTTREAAQRILEGLLAEVDGRIDAVAPFVSPRGPVEVAQTSGACDGEPAECLSTRSLVGIDAVEGVVADWFPLRANIAACEGDCCDVETVDDRRGDVFTKIESICVRRDSGGVVTLSKLETTFGP